MREAQELSQINFRVKIPPCCTESVSSVGKPSTVLPLPTVWGKIRDNRQTRDKSFWGIEVAVSFWMSSMGQFFPLPNSDTVIHQRAEPPTVPWLGCPRYGTDWPCGSDPTAVLVPNVTNSPAPCSTTCLTTNVSMGKFNVLINSPGFRIPSDKFWITKIANFKPSTFSFWQDSERCFFSCQDDNSRVNNFFRDWYCYQIKYSSSFLFKHPLLLENHKFCWCTLERPCILKKCYSSCMMPPRCHVSSFPHSLSSYYPILTFPSQAELKSLLKTEFTICHARSLQRSCKSAPATKRSVWLLSGEENLISFLMAQSYISHYFKWNAKWGGLITEHGLSSMVLSKYFLVLSYARHLACFLLQIICQQTSVLKYGILLFWSCFTNIFQSLEFLI